MSLTREIVDKTLSNQCLICNVQLSHPNAIKDHFQSKKHQKKMGQYVLANEGKFPSVTIEEPSLANGKITSAHDQLKEKLEEKTEKGAVAPFPFDYHRPQTYTCDVCKTSLDSKSLKESHIKQFPHADLLELKRDLMRKGCSSDFYSVYHNKYVYCSLCQISLACTSSVKSHCNSAKHQRNLKLQLAKPIQIPVHISKWYYCKLCDKNLDGTSDSDNHIHYVAQSRAVTLPPNGQATVTSFNPDTKVATIPINLGYHFHTRIWPSLSSGPKPDIVSLSPVNPSTRSEEKPPDLRAQIFTELEKLVQTLYYAKKLPESVSLEYLKKVNREVKTIIENHSKSPSVSNTVVPKAKTGADTVNKTETKEIKSQPVVKPPAQVKSQAVVKPPAVAAGSTNQINKNETKEVKSQAVVKPPAVAAGSTNQINKTETTEVKPVVLVKPPEKALQGEALKQEPKQNTPFSNLLTEIVDEKHRLRKAGKQTNPTKLEVISEIETLLLQVSEPKVPLQEVLDCLKKFNGIINVDLDCMKKRSSQPCMGM